jgi:hypothetical protein
MIDAFSQAGWPINRFNFGAKAGNDLAFVSCGAEAWVSFGKQVTNGEVVLIRDDLLISQLTSRKSVFDSRGRTGLEKKEDLRSRGLKSSLDSSQPVPIAADQRLTMIQGKTVSFTGTIRLCEGEPEIDVVSADQIKG